PCCVRVLVRTGASCPGLFVRGCRLVRYGGVRAVPVAGGKPVRVRAETGLRSPDGRVTATIRAERRPGAPTGTQSIVVGGRTIYTVRESYRQVRRESPGRSPSSRGRPTAAGSSSTSTRWAR